MVRDVRRSSVRASAALAPARLARVNSREVPRPDEVLAGEEIWARHHALDGAVDDVIACYRGVAPVAAAYAEWVGTRRLLTRAAALE